MPAGPANSPMDSRIAGEGVANPDLRQGQLPRVLQGTHHVHPDAHSVADPAGQGEVGVRGSLINTCSLGSVGDACGLSVSNVVAHTTRTLPA